MITLFAILLTLIVYGFIFWLIWWAISAIGIAEPFLQIVKTIVVIASVIIVIGLLTGYIAPMHYFVGTSLR